MAPIVYMVLYSRHLLYLWVGADNWHLLICCVWDCLLSCKCCDPVMVEMESVWTPGHTPPRGSGAQAPATGPWPGVRDRYECWAMLRTGHRLCPGAGAAQCWHHTLHTHQPSSTLSGLCLQQAAWCRGAWLGGLGQGNTGTGLRWLQSPALERQ